MVGCKISLLLPVLKTIKTLSTEWSGISDLLSGIPYFFITLINLSLALRYFSTFFYISHFKIITSVSFYFHFIFYNATKIMSTLHLCGVMMCLRKESAYIYGPPYNLSSNKFKNITPLITENVQMSMTLLCRNLLKTQKVS